MAKITGLTGEQVADLAVARAKWLAIGLSTAPLDEDAAKAAVSRMYACADLVPPKAFVFLDGPLQGAVAAAMMSPPQVGAQVRAQVWAQVGDQVRDQVWAQVWDQVRAQVWAQVGYQVRAQVSRAVYGSQEAPQSSYYDFFLRHFGLAVRASGLLDVARECGWVWPFSSCAIITRRPSTIAMDAENRLHRADGPAVSYLDGLSVYAWHGVHIPPDWIERPETLTAADAVSWPNVEQRRAAIEILGWGKILTALDAKSLGGNPDPKIGELIEVQLPFDDGNGRARTRALFLKAQCGTGRTIFEAVDPDEIDLDPRFDPAWCAQAWRDGYPPADWLPPSFRT